jgi:hypothetical protein
MRAGSSRPDQPVEHHDDVYFTRPGDEDAPTGVIFTRPPAKQPADVPPELLQYLAESHVSSEVLDAVRGTLVPYGHRGR